MNVSHYPEGGSYKVITVIEWSRFVALRVLTLAASVPVLLGTSIHVADFLLYSIMITSLYMLDFWQTVKSRVLAHWIVMDYHNYPTKSYNCKF